MRLRRNRALEKCKHSAFKMRMCVRVVLMDSFMRYVTYNRQKHAGLLDSPVGTYSVNWEVKSSIYCCFKLLLYRKQQFRCIFIMLFSITLFNVATVLHLMNLNRDAFEISESSFKYVNLGFHTIYMPPTTYSVHQKQNEQGFLANRSSRNPVSIKSQVVIQGRYNCHISH